MSRNVIFLRDLNVKMAGRSILKDVDFTVLKNEFVYITGDTGSGKSSLLKSLYGEYPILSGVANMLNYDLTVISHKELPYLRRKIGIVFQDFELLTDRTSYENLEFVLRATGWNVEKEIKKAIERSLEEVGIDECMFKRPYQMSGGEQQRLGIARAIINSPEIIFADEPTGNLDPETSEAVLDILLDINRTGKTILMATHDYTLIEKHPSRIVQFQFGELISDSESEE